MNLDSGSLQTTLSRLQAVAGQPRRFVVAFSGGLDSSVLLHALAAGRAAHGVEVAAIHVDHGLHADSADWARQAASRAAALGVEIECCRVEVDRHSGTGLEAAARTARYAALRARVDAGDWLLTAHHADDQAETVLLHLVRGSGTDGLTGIPEARRLGAGWLVRPLLDAPRAELEAYAARFRLAALADPTNTDRRFDRNFLRHEVLPLLARRWPGAGRGIGRSARLAREAATLLWDLAALDRAQVADPSGRLSVDALGALAEPRQRNLLRFVIRELGLPMPGAAPLERIVRELLPARCDAQPLVSWPGAEARRYRDRIYLLPSAVVPAAVALPLPCGDQPIALPAGLGTLALVPGAASGLSDAVVARGLVLRFRAGGEGIRPENHRYTKQLKKLFQEEGIVPWMRDRLPLVYAGGELVAVADLWLAADAVSAPGTAVVWQQRPALH